MFKVTYIHVYIVTNMHRYHPKLQTHTHIYIYTFCHPLLVVKNHEFQGKDYSEADGG